MSKTDEMRRAREAAAARAPTKSVEGVKAERGGWVTLTDVVEVRGARAPAVTKRGAAGRLAEGGVRRVTGGDGLFGDGRRRPGDSATVAFRVTKAGAAFLAEHPGGVGGAIREALRERYGR